MGHHSRIIVFTLACVLVASAFAQTFIFYSITGVVNLADGSFADGRPYTISVTYPNGSLVSSVSGVVGDTEVHGFAQAWVFPSETAQTIIENSIVNVSLDGGYFTCIIGSTCNVGTGNLVYAGTITLGASGGSTEASSSTLTAQVTTVPASQKTQSQTVAEATTPGSETVSTTTLTLQEAQETVASPSSTTVPGALANLLSIMRGAGGSSSYPVDEPVASCLDGIRNSGEEGVDCGGPCPPCVVVKKGLPKWIIVAGVLFVFAVLAFFIILLIVLVVLIKRKG